MEKKLRTRIHKKRLSRIFGTFWTWIFRTNNSIKNQKQWSFFQIRIFKTQNVRFLKKNWIRGSLNSNGFSQFLFPTIYASVKYSARVRKPFDGNMLVRDVRVVGYYSIFQKLAQPNRTKIYTLIEKLYVSFERLSRNFKQKNCKINNKQDKNSLTFFWFKIWHNFIKIMTFHFRDTHYRKK